MQTPQASAEPAETLTFVLNGEERRVPLPDPDIPLLFLLRDAFALSGTKIGCTEGLCGVCTVHLDGKAVRSCITPAADVEGAEVTTIEGLSEKGDHPVQRAWIAARVPQCGYCQPGQIMQAAAFLAEVSEPGAEEIAAAMAGNLCRCGTGPRILAAVAEAAAIARQEPKDG